MSLLLMSACAQIATRPGELQPLVEVQFYDTPTHADDYYDAAPGMQAAPARIRIVNVGQNGGVTADVPVVLSNMDPCPGRCLGGQVGFASSSTGTVGTTMGLTLPKTGAWVPFFVRGLTPNFQAALGHDNDAVVEVRENRTGGVVLARANAAVYQSNLRVAPKAESFVAAILEVDGSAITLDDYVGWTPVLASVRLASPGPGTPATIRNGFHAYALGSAPHGELLFGMPVNGGPPPVSSMTPTLPVMLPGDGGAVQFYVAGDYQNPSVRDKDALIQVTSDGNLHALFDAEMLDELGVMVRIRKDANAILPIERDRFLRALAALKTQTGTYADFVAINAQVGTRAYCNCSNPTVFNAVPAFLPWHRMFLLRFERELQAIDPGVSILYWRFDAPAPNVFNVDFMGTSPSNSNVLTSIVNPLHAWGIQRRPSFAPGADPTAAVCPTPSEAAIMALGGAGNQFLAVNNNYVYGFSTLEWPAYFLVNRSVTTACYGISTDWLVTAATAAKDPLFFLLTANDDRLWAKWQQQYGRLDPANPASYATATIACGTGQCLNDTMWPWNTTAYPGGPFPAGVGNVLEPPPAPTPKNAVDYLHSYIPSTTAHGLGYAYDDVPFSP